MCAVGEGAAPSSSAGREDDPSHLFGRVVGASRLSDGSVVVVDPSVGEVLIVDETGKHLRSLGDFGDGPGDFRRPWCVWVWSGDTLWVGDYRPWRYNVFAGRRAAGSRLSQSVHGRRRAVGRCAGRVQEHRLEPVLRDPGHSGRRGSRRGRQVHRCPRASPERAARLALRGTVGTCPSTRSELPVPPCAKGRASAHGSMRAAQGQVGRRNGITAGASGRGRAAPGVAGRGGPSGGLRPTIMVVRAPGDGEAGGREKQALGDAAQAPSGSLGRFEQDALGRA